MITVPSASASWAPDLFGGIRRSVEANTALAQASAGDLESTRLLLQSEIASDYFMLRGLDTEKRLLDDNVVAYQHALDLTVNRFQQGVASQVDVTQAETQLAQTRAQATDTLVQRQQTEHAIAILLGKPPSEVSIPLVILSPVPPPIPGVIPSELLQRRPDIAANERRVAAANAQIGVAHRGVLSHAFACRLGGMEAAACSSLFSWPQPLLVAGPIVFRARSTMSAGAAASPRKRRPATITPSRSTAKRVLDRLPKMSRTTWRASAPSSRRPIADAGAVNYAERSLQFATAQYQGGIATYLQVISAQEIALTNQVTSVVLETRRMTAAVALVQALGGDGMTRNCRRPKK